MKQERGFAMLLVFVMAATVAIMLYKELPRVAFEAQRSKEELLIERGEQYTRAIQLYVRKFKKYPAKIEDLEETNQLRFLRKRYIDPMTGKSEWRLIHIGPGGVFTDSLTHKPPGQKQEEKAVNTFTYEAPTIGSTVQQEQAPPGFPPARPSDRAGLRLPGQTQPGQGSDPSNPQQQQPGYPQTGFVPGYPNPNQPNPNQPNPNQPNPNPQAGGPNPNQQPGANPQQPGFNPQQVGQQPYGQPQPGAYPGPPANSQTGGVSPFPYSTQPGAQGAQPPFPQPGGTTTPGAQQPGQNQALNLINQILTTPRPQGGLAAGTGQPLGTQIGGGIAGVASTLERAGIKIYNEKQKYNEWEFLYDLTKDKTGMGAAMAAGGMPQQQQQQQQGTPAQPQTQQTPANTSPFGGQPFGGQTPFGNPPTGAVPPPPPVNPQPVNP
jgi:type II secretory pathway pseudopilin PulG